MSLFLVGGKKSYSDILNLRHEGNNEKAATWKEFIEQRFPGEFEGAVQWLQMKLGFRSPGAGNF